MKNEMKKKYVAPEMDVIQYELVSNLLACSSGSPTEECPYGGPLGLNDGVSDVEHV